jgi:cysteine synthase B
MGESSLLPSADSDALLRTIGNTPLIPLLRIGREFPRVRILAKAEWYNPGGSVKDRPAYRMIRAAEVSGRLTPGKIVLDATSGNTGIAYAMIAARRGYRCKLLMPARATKVRSSGRQHEHTQSVPSPQPSPSRGEGTGEHTEVSSPLRARG